MTMIEEWKIAAKKLNLDIVTPFTLVLPSGAIIKAQLLLKNFGAHNGMILFNGEDNRSIQNPLLEEMVQAGSGYSILSEPESDTIDWESFIDMLNDWGWVPCEKKKPEWVKDDLNGEEKC